MAPAFNRIDRNKPRVDKAFLINAGRLMERRDGREVEVARTRIAALEAELEQVRKDGAVSAAMAATGGGPVKILQREVSELREKLSTLEEHTPDNASVEVAVAANGPSRSESSSASSSRSPSDNLSAAQTRIQALEAQVERLEQQAEEHAQRQSVGAVSPSGGAAATCRTCGELEDAIAGLQGRVETLSEVSSSVLAILIKQSDIEDVVKLERLTTRLAEADKRVEALENEVAVARAAGTKKGKELERIRREKDAGCEKLEKEWRLRYETELRARNATDAAADASALRYADLITNLRMTEDDVATLLAEGPNWPPIRAQMHELSLLDLLWLLTDQEDGSAEELRMLRAKVAHLEGEAVKFQRRASEQVKDEKERCKKTIDELKARVEDFEATTLSHPGTTSQVSAKALGAGHSFGCSQTVVEHLTRRIADLNEQVSELRDENMALLLRLAGADE
ncbi:hypothetical protein JCM3770_004123 [Rhodotorula araucariae]